MLDKSLTQLHILHTTLLVIIGEGEALKGRVCRGSRRRRIPDQGTHHGPTSVPCGNLKCKIDGAKRGSHVYVHHT